MKPTRQATLVLGDEKGRRKTKRQTDELPAIGAKNSGLWLVGQRSIHQQHAGRYTTHIMAPDLTGNAQTVKHHPGKMFPDLAAAIVETYTRPGDRVLDPMGGIGTTAVEAAERGRHCTIIEIEEGWAAVARLNANAAAERGATGRIEVVQGDARQLVALVDSGNLDAVITSPPYGPANTGNGIAKNGFYDDPRPLAERCGGGTYDAVISSPPYGDIRQDGGNHRFNDGAAMENYSGEDRGSRNRNRSNIGNLKYGSMADAIRLAERLRRAETVEAEQGEMQYLETMVMVYHQCYQVLKPGALAVLVLRDYRRDHRRVDLVGDTIRLMQALGYVYHDRILAVTSTLNGDYDRSDLEPIFERVQQRGWHGNTEHQTKRISQSIKVSPFVRIAANKAARLGRVPQMIPVGEEVLIFKKPEKEVPTRGKRSGATGRRAVTTDTGTVEAGGGRETGTVD